MKPDITLLLTLVLTVSACAPSREEPTSRSPIDPVADPNDCVVLTPDKPFACTMQYDPVCGCDGNTYSNACSARAAGVPHSTPGACDKQDLQ